MTGQAFRLKYNAEVLVARMIFVRFQLYQTFIALVRSLSKELQCAKSRLAMRVHVLRAENTALQNGMLSDTIHPIILGQKRINIRSV